MSATITDFIDIAFDLVKEGRFDPKKHAVGPEEAEDDQIARAHGAAGGKWTGEKGRLLGRMITAKDVHEAAAKGKAIPYTPKEHTELKEGIEEYKARRKKSGKPVDKFLGRHIKAFESRSAPQP